MLGRAVQPVFQRFLAFLTLTPHRGNRLFGGRGELGQIRFALTQQLPVVRRGAGGTGLWGMLDGKLAQLFRSDDGVGKLRQLILVDADDLGGGNGTFAGRARQRDILRGQLVQRSPVSQQRGQFAERNHRNRMIRAVVHRKTAHDDHAEFAGNGIVKPAKIEGHVLRRRGAGQQRIQKGRQLADDKLIALHMACGLRGLLQHGCDGRSGYFQTSGGDTQRGGG